MKAIKEEFKKIHMENEIWKDIAGYEGLYQISSFGNVKSLLRTVDRGVSGLLVIKEKILKVGLDNAGYYHVSLCKNNKGVTLKIHRLVAINFIENKLNVDEVNHIDRNKLNNNISNLEWVSKRENCTHREINKNWTSNYVGVHKSSGRNKWTAAIRVNNKVIRLGNYSTELEAYNRRCNYEKENNILNKYL